jgi:hypothetical protein
MSVYPSSEKLPNIPIIERLQEKAVDNNIRQSLWTINYGKFYVDDTPEAYPTYGYFTVSSSQPILSLAISSTPSSRGRIYDSRTFPKTMPPGHTFIKVLTK